MSTIRCRKPAILRNLRPDTDAVIEASAGTGKTFTIEHLLIELLLETDTPVESILVVTFTEKATGELRARVRKKIETLLRQRESDQDADCVWELDDTRRRKLERALFRFDTAPIHTIHGFCRRVLNENAFLNRQLFSQELVDAPVIFSRVFRQMLRDTFLLDPERSAFLEAWLETGTIESLESLLLRVAGLGATVEPAWEPDTAAKVLADMAEVFDYDVLEKECASLRKNSVPKTLRNLALIDEALTQFRDLGNVVPFLRMWDRLEIGASNHFKIPADCGPASAQFFKIFDWWKAQGPRFESALVQTFLHDIQTRLRAEKTRRGMYDFQDLLERVHDSLREGPFAAALQDTLRRRYRFAVVDEFQDTDEIQWEIFRKLFAESTHNTLYVVGDPKQAIYGFRGADVHTYAHAVPAIIGDTEPLQLEDNYRSTAAVIDAYNSIFTTAENGEEDRPFFSGFNRYPHPVRCGDPSLRAVSGDGKPVKPVRVLHYKGEDKISVPLARRLCGERMAQEIHRILNDDGYGVHLTRGETPGAGERVTARDIFVLTESGSQAVEAAAYLREAGVPYAFYKQDGLFQTAEAADVRDLLAGILDADRIASRLRAWSTPFFAVPWRALEDARALPETDPLVERLKLWAQRAEQEQWGALFTGIMEESGIIQRELFLSESERELTNYMHLLELLLETAVRNRCSGPELLRMLDGYIAGAASPEGEEGNTQRIESERDAVQIMTLHKSKGLQAAIVFVFALGNRPNMKVHLYHDETDRRCLFIGSASHGDVSDAIERETREEKQRLFYVGLTRAKCMLYLPYLTPAAKGPTGGYRIVNDRLDAMFGGEQPATGDPHFEVISVGDGDASVEDSRDGVLPLEQAGTWVPPAVLLRDPEPDPLFEECLATHRPVALTSYSQMKKRASTLAVEEVDPRADEHSPAETMAVPHADERPVLPGGINTGLFLHALLEHADLTRLQSRPNLSAWMAEPEQQRLLERMMRRYSIPPAARDYAAMLVYRALTNGWVLDGDGATVEIPGIASCLPKVGREMEFLYPIPEAAHPRILEAPPEQRLRIERGYIKGFVDLIFEHDGRIYFADWKSDLLSDYSDARMHERVQQMYQLQLDVYSLALVKMFGLQDAQVFEERFGGVIYLFLRGLEEGRGQQGVYFRRPSREDIMGYERRIMDQPVARGHG